MYRLHICPSTCANVEMCRKCGDTAILDANNFLAFYLRKRLLTAQSSEMTLANAANVCNDGISKTEGHRDGKEETFLGRQRGNA